ncbi:hypothetical protein Lal_00022112 [Lupinus albus]|nr:hypothetical protein Lal_00022112 [Lupinus albus]
MKGKESAFSCSSQSQTLNLIDVEADGVNVDWRAKYQFSEQNFTTAHHKSELDIYLEDGVLPDQRGEFDILASWKINEIKYSTLQRIEIDLLAIPISIFASESSFSTRGRILTPHRSRLRLDIVEVLMCLQERLRGDMKGAIKIYVLIFVSFSEHHLSNIQCGKSQPLLNGTRRNPNRRPNKNYYKINSLHRYTNQKYQGLYRYNIFPQSSMPPPGTSKSGNSESRSNDPSEQTRIEDKKKEERE